MSIISAVVIGRLQAARGRARIAVRDGVLPPEGGLPGRG